VPPYPVDTIGKEFVSLIDRADVTEADVQRYLEEHSELIPTPFLLGHDLHGTAIISKFEIDRDKKVDLAYLTKNTAYWQAVFVELERPQKQLFIDNPNPDFHSDTRAAIAQIEYWKGLVKDHLEVVRRRLFPLLVPRHFCNNPIQAKYLLIIGRTPPGGYSQAHSARIKGLAEENNIQLCTYDSILRMGPGHGIGYKKNILVHDRDAFRFKHIHTSDTDMLAYHLPNELGVSEEQKRWLTGQGLDMNAWSRGQRLVLRPELFDRNCLGFDVR